MHEHCQHQLEHCPHCDTVRCVLCSKEWQPAVEDSPKKESKEEITGKTAADWLEYILRYDFDSDKRYIG